MEFYLFLSMFIYLIYIFSLNFVNFAVRKKAIMNGEIPYKYFKSFQGADLPEKVATHMRHHDNQYQAPIIFFISGALLLSTEVNLYSVILGWAFVFSRFLHSYILVVSKNVLNRAKVFLLGWIIIILMWIQVGMNYCERI